jgi:hypothetical protein
VLLAVHTVPEQVSAILTTFKQSGATEVDTANWSE